MKITFVKVLKFQIEKHNINQEQKLKFQVSKDQMNAVSIYASILYFHP